MSKIEKINEAVGDFFFYPVKHLKKWCEYRKYCFRISRPISFIHRGRYGWAKRDVWGLYYYLSKVIVGSLEELRDTTHGIPTGMIGNQGIDCDRKSKEMKKWLNILDEIIEGFELVIQSEADIDENVDFVNPKNVSKEYYEHYKDDIANYKKLMHSLDLFKKYFLDLWD